MRVVVRGCLIARRVCRVPGVGAGRGGVCAARRQRGAVAPTRAAPAARLPAESGGRSAGARGGCRHDCPRRAEVRAGRGEWRCGCPRRAEGRARVPAEGAGTTARGGRRCGLAAESGGAGVRGGRRAERGCPRRVPARLPAEGGGAGWPRRVAVRVSAEGGGRSAGARGGCRHDWPRRVAVRVSAEGGGARCGCLRRAAGTADSRPRRGGDGAGVVARSGWRVRAPDVFQLGQSRQSEDGHPRPGPAPPTTPGRQSSRRARA